MKTLILLATSFLLPLISWAQFHSWEFDISPTSMHTKKAFIFEDQTSNTIYASSSGTIHTMDYGGEPKQVNFIPSYNSSLNYYLFFNKSIQYNQDIFLSVTHNAHWTNRFTFQAFDLYGTPLNDPLQISTDVSSYQEAFLIGNTFTIFSSTGYSKVKLNDDFSWEEIVPETNLFTEVKQVIQLSSEDRFLVRQEQMIQLVDNNGQIVWTKNFDQKISSIQAGNGNDTWVTTYSTNEPSVIYHLNHVGEVISQWENPTTHYSHIIPTNGGLLFGLITESEQDDSSLHYTGTTLFSTQGEIVTTQAMPSKPIHAVKKLHNGNIAVISPNILTTIVPEIDKLAPRRHDELYANNISVIESGQSSLSEDTYGKIKFDDNKIRTIYSLTPAYTATQEDGTLVGNYELYLWDERTPVFLLDGQIIQHNKSVWSISRTEIEHLQAQLAAGNSITQYSQSMLTYPAKGNPFFTIDNTPVLIDRDLAPFVDVNNDGIYNALEGDYPDFEGDQMLWFSAVDPSGLEVNGMWYAYDCGDHTISNTVFSKYTFTNQSDHTLEDFQFSLLNDPDLGCNTDDYMGSIPELNSFFAYNMNEIDGISGTTCDGHTQIFNDEIPIQSVTFLNTDMTALGVFESPSFTNESNPYLELPTNYYEFRNIQNGLLYDGSPMIVGGDGTNPTGEITTFAYPGNPSESDEWSMAYSSLILSDKRLIPSVAAIDLAQGESVSFDFSYITHPNIPLPNPDITPVKATIQEVTNIFESEHIFPDVNLGPDLVIDTGDAIELDAGNDGVSYLWNTGETTQMIDATVGDYSVTVTDETGCQRTDMIHISSLPVTNKVASTIQTVKVSPNPSDTNSPISLDVIVNMDGDYEVSIRNFLGINIYQQPHSLKVSNTITLPSIVTSGVYFVTVADQKGNNKTSKFLIQ